MAMEAGFGSKSRMPILLKYIPKVPLLPIIWSYLRMGSSLWECLFDALA
jgi:hypothetical protein